VEKKDFLRQRHLLENQVRTLIGREAGVHPRSILGPVLLSEGSGGEQKKGRQEERSHGFPFMALISIELSSRGARNAAEGWYGFYPGDYGHLGSLIPGPGQAID
jgi:hypothetical protein